MQERFEAASAVCGTLDALYAYVPEGSMEQHSLWLHDLCNQHISHFTFQSHSRCIHIPFLIPPVNTEIQNLNVLKEVVGLYIRTGQDCADDSNNAVNEHTHIHNNSFPPRSAWTSR